MKNHIRLWRVASIVGIASTVIFGGAGVANATAGRFSDEVATDFQFGYFANESYETAYQTMLDYNGAKATAKFFEERLAAGGGAADLHPALAVLPADQQTVVLEQSAIAARSGSALDPEVAALGANNEVVVMAVPAATVIGSATADRRAWKANPRYNWSTCSPFCTVTSWIELRHTINPGHTSTRSDVTAVKFGTQLGNNVVVDAAVYGNGNFQDDNITTWYAANGAFFQIYNFYGSLNNQTYVFWESWIVSTPAGSSGSAPWKTGAGGDCYTSPSLGPICDW